MSGGVRIGSAFVQVTADTTGAFSGVGQAASASGQEAGGFFKSTFMKGLAGMGAALGGVFAVSKMKEFVSSAISGASDLDESIGKNNAVFGKSADGIMKWADGAAQNLGLAKSEALEMSGTFGNIFTQMGFGTGVAADMTTSIGTLASDLGAFNNIPSAEVADMFSAAMRGEYDSIQRVLPLINAAAVEQKALAMTGKASTKEITAQDKATALLALAQEGGVSAAGNFKDTQEGLAGATQTAGAEFRNLTDNIGTALLPIVTSLMSFVNTDLLPGLANIGSFIQTNAIPAIQSFIAGFKQALPVIASIAGAITLILLPALITSGVRMAITAAQSVLGWIAMAAGAVVNAAVVVASWVLMGFQSMLQAARMAAAWLIAMGPVGLVIAIVVGLVALIIANWDTIKAVTIAVFQAVATFLTTVWNNIVTWISQALTNIFNTVRTIFNNVKNFITTVFNVIKAGILIVWAGIVAGVTGYVNGVRSIITSVFNAVRGFITSVWNGIKSTITSAVQGVKNIVTSVFGAVRDTTSNIFNGVKNTISNIFEGIRSTISGAVEGIRSAVSNTFSTLAGIMTGAFDGVSGTIRGVINGVIGAINGAIGGINSAIGIANKLPGVNIPNMGSIPMLAKGGTLAKGGAAIVGEKGPELVTLPGGATVHPNGTRVTQPSTAASSSTQKITNNYHVTIDAKNVKDFNSVVEMMSSLNRTARGGRGSSNIRTA